MTHILCLDGDTRGILRPAPGYSSGLLIAIPAGQVNLVQRHAVHGIVDCSVCCGNRTGKCAGKRGAIARVIANSLLACCIGHFFAGSQVCRSVKQYRALASSQIGTVFLRQFECKIRRINGICSCKIIIRTYSARRSPCPFAQGNIFYIHLAHCVNQSRFILIYRDTLRLRSNQLHAVYFFLAKVIGFITVWPADGYLVKIVIACRKNFLARTGRQRYLTHILCLDGDTRGILCPAGRYVRALTVPTAKIDFIQGYLINRIFKVRIIISDAALAFCAQRNFIAQLMPYGKALVHRRGQAPRINSRRIRHENDGLAHRILVRGSRREFKAAYINGRIRVEAITTTIKRRIIPPGEFTQRYLLDAASTNGIEDILIAIVQLNNMFAVRISHSYAALGGGLFRAFPEHNFLGSTSGKGCSLDLAVIILQRKATNSTTRRQQIHRAGICFIEEIKAADIQSAHIAN